ncbi:hypothetical protein SPRG_03097 [Saprolegnia parasitica CBS 223.65]|uniref:Uncharacterized protein n=1 Tax=Saprolegnia parasitica (strain CBS 223.65) TaxID=695850 RepID=A0A067CZD5_SAPPC|nr:hypothetical protein SPRG_03097 [Saprolegnia parasitica CBS 223.65]KDO31881.1 hypothetical protein SPRG_03097 [Saprolegnia parasitica CBS 223.65]|eukprot:XP_012197080.1 hypothetical protein SPRG_03097 [Saprolegnia parasitica CBS 223.65]
MTTDQRTDVPAWAPQAFATAANVVGPAALYIDDDRIDLPLTDAIAARYANCDTTNVRAEFAGGWSAVHQWLKERLVPEGPCSVQFSHLAVDTVGSASSLEPMAPPPTGCFGRLLVRLPSRYAGGGITTPMRLAPITRGVRAILVYYLVYSDPTTHSRCQPPTDAEAVAAWIPRCAAKLLPFFYGCQLTQPSSTLSFEPVSATDVRFLSAVAATKAFDDDVIAYTPWPGCKCRKGSSPA